MRAVILAVGLLVSPALVGDQISRWEPFRAENICGVQTIDADGTAPTTFTLMRGVDGKTVVTLRNERWSVKAGDTHSLYMLVDKDLFEGPAHGSNDHMISFSAPANILSAMRSGNLLTAFLKVDDDHEKALGQFDLRGSAAALSNIEKCVAEETVAARGKKSEQDRLERREKIAPVDPFANSAKPD